MHILVVSIEERTGKARPLMESRQGSSELRRSSMKSRTTNLARPLNANPHCYCLGLELNHGVAATNSIRLNLRAHVRSLANAWTKRKAVIPINIYHETTQIFKCLFPQNLKMLTVVTVLTQADIKTKQKPKK